MGPNPFPEIVSTTTSAIAQMEPMNLVTPFPESLIPVFFLVNFVCLDCGLTQVAKN